MEPKIILEIPKLQLKSLKIFIQSYKSQTLGYESQFLLHFCGEKCHIIYLLYISAGSVIKFLCSVGHRSFWNRLGRFSVTRKTTSVLVRSYLKILALSVKLQFLLILEHCATASLEMIKNMIFLIISKPQLHIILKICTLLHQNYGSVQNQASVIFGHVLVLVRFGLGPRKTLSVMDFRSVG